MTGDARLCAQTPHTVFQKLPANISVQWLEPISGGVTVIPSQDSPTFPFLFFYF